MSTLTPIGSRLQIALDGEFLRMVNEWFFKWHRIKDLKGAVEIDSFNGPPIRLGGIAFSGSAVDIYWDTIRRYARQRVGSIFDEIEGELQHYPVEVRRKALSEAIAITQRFITKIRQHAVERDRILRGDGMNFPAHRDIGDWTGARHEDVASRGETLSRIYCDLPAVGNGDDMPFRDLMADKVTLVKKDGTIVREGIQAQVGSGKIITFDADLPLEPGDHFLRTLPSGLVEDYEVDDPNFLTGHHSIPSSFRAKVHRTREAIAPQQQIVRDITAHFHGANSRLTVGTDASVNVVIEVQPLAIAGLLDQLRPYVGGLPEPERSQIAKPIRLLEDEIKSGKPDQSKLRTALQSMKTIAEGATGNLVAAGIASMIGQMHSG